MLSILKKSTMSILGITLNVLTLAAFSTTSAQAVASCRIQCKKLDQKDQKRLNACAQQCAKDIDIAEQLVNRSHELSDKGRSSFLITLKAEQRKARDDQEKIEGKLIEETSKREKNKDRRKIRDLKKQQDQVIDRLNRLSVVIKKLQPQEPINIPPAPSYDPPPPVFPKKDSPVVSSELMTSSVDSNVGHVPPSLPPPPSLSSSPRNSIATSKIPTSPEGVPVQDGRAALLEEIRKRKQDS